VHPNSLKAYHEELERTFNPREKEVMGAIRRLGVCTDRDVLEALDQVDMNYVRPRITHLLELGAIEETGTVRDPVTKKTVRKVRIRITPLASVVPTPPAHQMSLL
jgi:hypothetical protein